MRIRAAHTLATKQVWILIQVHLWIWKVFNQFHDIQTLQRLQDSGLYNFKSFSAWADWQSHGSTHLLIEITENHIEFLYETSWASCNTSMSLLCLSFLHLFPQLILFVSSFTFSFHACGHCICKPPRLRNTRVQMVKYWKPPTGRFSKPKPCSYGKVTHLRVDLLHLLSFEQFSWCKELRNNSSHV